MFKRMLVPICEECFEKFVKERAEKPPPKQEAGMPVKERVNLLSPKQEPGMPVKEYYELFQAFILLKCIPINSFSARILFIAGLSEENKKEVRRFTSLHNDRSISDMICYLSSVEAFRKTIFGNIDGLVPDEEPMDV